MKQSNSTGYIVATNLVHGVHSRQVVQHEVSDACSDSRGSVPFPGGVDLHRGLLGDLAVNSTVVAVRNQASAMHVGV